MSRFLPYLLGPELYWLLAYGVTALLASRNAPPTEAGNRLLEHAAWVLPLVAIPLSFVLFFWLAAPPQARGWLLARLLLASFVGLNVCLFHVAGAIDYGDSRNSGLLGVWAIGFGLGVILFIVASLVLALFWWRDRAV